MDLKAYTTTGSLLQDIERAEVIPGYIGPMLAAIEDVFQTKDTGYILRGEVSVSSYHAINTVLDTIRQEQIMIHNPDVLYLLILRFLVSNDNNHNARLFWKLGQILHYSDASIHTRFIDIASLFEKTSLDNDIAIRHMGDVDICKIAMLGGFVSMVRDYLKEPVLQEDKIMERLSLLHYFVSGSAYAEFSAPWLCDTLESIGSEMVFYIYIMYKRGYSIPGANNVINWEYYLADNVYQMFNNNELNPNVMKTEDDWKLFEEIKALYAQHVTFSKGLSL